MRSYYLVPLLALAAVLSSNAFSRPPAAIKYGRDLASVMNPSRPELGKSLDELKFGAEIPVCYEGKKNEVCELVAKAIEDRNGKQRLDGRLKFELTACDRDQAGTIRVDILGPPGQTLTIPPIPRCT